MAKYITIKRLNPGSEDPQICHEMMRYNLGLSTVRDNGYWCHLIMIEDEFSADKDIVLQVVENRQDIPSMLHRSSLTIKLDSGDIELGNPSRATKEEEYTNPAGNRFFERAAYFSLSKEQLKQICESNNAKLEFTGGGKSKNAGQDFITWCQYFYHHMIDKTVYNDVDQKMDKIITANSWRSTIVTLIIIALLIVGIILMFTDHFLTGFIMVIVAIIAALIKSPTLRMLVGAFSR